MAPQFGEKAFNCPHCGAYAQQDWDRVFVTARIPFVGADPLPGRIRIATCVCCGEASIWVDEKMVYPLESPAPLPSEDMPEDIRRDYKEARAIVAHSPRAAAALLRLATEKLVIHLLGGDYEGNLNDGIAELVKRGLPQKIQKALDTLRVIGNQSVHPGQIDLSDDFETATALFEALNLIVEYMITAEKKIDEMYKMLPEDKRQAIEKRDGATFTVESC